MSINWRKIRGLLPWHAHVEADITDLGPYAADPHTHVEADITDLGPYAADPHTHTESDITDLGTYLENVEEDTTPELGGDLSGAGFNINNVAFLQLTAATNETRGIEVGTGRNTDGISYADFVGDATYTDYGLRVIRNGSSSQILHRGTGAFQIANLEAGSFQILTNSVQRVYVDTGLIAFDLPLYIKEQAAAAGDVASYGQFWVKDDTPNVPMFTDDAGTDIQLVGMESGTFTPTIQDDSLSDGEGQTYSVQAGLYRKIGDLIHFWVRLQITSLGTLSTGQQLRIAGLPYASEDVGSFYFSWGNLLALGSDYSVTGVINPGNTYIEMFKWSTSAGATILTLAQLSNDAWVYGHGAYLQQT